MNTVCAAPLSWDELLAYWLGELDGDREADLEQHYLGCAACSGRLARLAVLGREVRFAVRTGAVSAVLADGFVHKLSEQGLRVREYRVPPNGSVHCTVAPEDDLVVGRLEAALTEVPRVDLLYLGDDGEPVSRHEDVPFAARSGVVVAASSIATLRALPETTVRLRLVAVQEEGERTLGEYTFHHTPHPGTSN